ncbi:hypothetical protein AB0O34_26180 [Sphaerisporangium sp. NPDC088356]|uniref:WD40 repeat domain-containing protein n=1 Tax=Sphaerisporangium sp. NPDC088356 TaxID=3154871 RepID=UPI00343F4F26
MRVWDAGSGALTSIENGHTDRVFAAAWSPDGSRLASGSGDDTILVGQPGSGKPAVAVTHGGAAVEDLAWSPDGSRIASGGHDATIRIWDARRPRPQTRSPGQATQSAGCH